MTKLQIGRLREERGFTLIELLVVILIIGILAAIAIPSLLSQKSKAYDSSAKTLAQTAQTAMETYSTENGGNYEKATAQKLHEIEPSINTSNSNEAELLETTQSAPTSFGVAGSGKPTANEYTVTVRALSTKDEYSVTRTSTGTAEHRCLSNSKSCPGHSESSTSW
jgi:type IV pilus assembly protein PilA